MFLLIPIIICGSKFKGHIYIPLCFYLYYQDVINDLADLHIYIPLCFYLYKYSYECYGCHCAYLHSTMFLLIPRSFFSLNPCRLPSSKLSISLFSSTSSSFFLLIFLLSSILLQKYALCRLPTVSALSQVDNHRKLLVLSSWMPQNSFGIHFSFLHLKIINESLSSRMTLFNSIFSFRSCDSDISPSKTEF